MANSIITKTAKEKIVKARANVAPVSIIAGIAFGDGGANGDDIIPPSIDATALSHELLRKAAQTVTQVSDTSYRYKCTLTATDIPDAAISEIGLYDSDGDLVSIRTFKAKIKDPDIDMVFEIDDTF